MYIYLPVFQIGILVPHNTAVSLAEDKEGVHGPACVVRRLRSSIPRHDAPAGSRSHCSCRVTPRALRWVPLWPDGLRLLTLCHVGVLQYHWKKRKQTVRYK